MNLNFRRLVPLASGVLLSLLTGCIDPEQGSSDSNWAANAAETQWQGDTAEAATLPSPEETFNTALILGDRAQADAAQAQSEADWQPVAGRLERALNLLRAIPPNSTLYNSAQAQILDYEAQLNQAREQLAQLRG